MNQSLELDFVARSQQGMFFTHEGKAQANNDEERLLLENSKTDAASFKEIYERYFTRIYVYCLRRVRQPEDAEDVTSLIFIKAFANLENYRGGSVAAWLFQIAHNAVINHLRAKRPQISLETAISDGLEDNLTDFTNPILDQIVELEKRSIVQALIDDLPLAQREILALSVNAGLTAKEVGEVIGKSEGAVGMALHRIVKRLQLAYHKKAQLEVEKE